MSTQSSGMSEVLNLSFLYKVQPCMVTVLQFSYFERRAKKTIFVCLYNVTNAFKMFFYKNPYIRIFLKKKQLQSNVFIAVFTKY